MLSRDPHLGREGPAQTPTQPGPPAGGMPVREPGSPSPSFPVRGRPLCPPQLSSIRPHPQASWSERCFPWALPSPAAQQRPGCVMSVTRSGCDPRRMEVGARGQRTDTHSPLHTRYCWVIAAGIGGLWALAVVLSILSALKFISSSKQNHGVKDRASLLWRKLCLVHRVKPRPLGSGHCTTAGGLLTPSAFVMG